MEANSKKRVRDDPELEFEHGTPESKRVHSVTESDSGPPGSKISRDHSVAHSLESSRGDLDPEIIDSSAMKHIPEDILDILSDSETVNDRDPAIQGLDSVIKSFEEEIHHNSFPPLQQSAVFDLTSDSGESQPDLGYLLEASDDELGLPPAEQNAAYNEPLVNLTVANSSDAIELGNMIEFEDEFTRYDSFEFGLSESAGATNNNIINASGSGDFVTVDGLFDYSEPSDFSGPSWRPESLPAL